jgi:hypothetical protein
MSTAPTTGTSPAPQILTPPPTVNVVLQAQPVTRWDWVVRVVSIVAALGAVGAFGANCWQANEARKQVVESQKQTAEAQRQSTAASKALDLTLKQYLLDVQEARDRSSETERFIAASNEKAKAAEIEEWQRFEVYEIIRECEDKGITFKDILLKYRSGSVAVEFKVPSRELSEERLKRILANLQMTGTIGYGGGGTYYHSYGVDTYAMKAVRIDECKLFMMLLLQNESGKFSAAELIGKATNPPDNNGGGGYSNDIAVASIVALMSSNAIKPDKSGKIVSITAATPMPTP